MATPETHRDPGARRAFWLALGFFLAGCGENAVPVLGFAHPTLVEVSPEDFLGSVPCRPEPGAMRRYVATVYDVSIGADGAGGQASVGCAGDEAGEAGAPPNDGSGTSEFALPSSTLNQGNTELATPIPCTESVGFSRIVDDHKYRAEVDGYDRDDLVALTPGARILYDPVTAERVEPRWTTSCSKCTPVRGQRFAVRRIGNCKPLDDSAPSGEARVEVRLDAALDGRECGSAPGAVERFEVTPPAGAFVGAACGEAVTLVGLEPTRGTLTLPLRAFEAGATEATWGTTCLAEVVQGVTTTATCLPLASTGVLEVVPADALAALGLECDGAAFEELDIEMTDGDADPRHTDASGCASRVRFLDRAPGMRTARVSARFADGTRSAAALCTGAVVPGDTVRATCAREP